MDQKENVEKPQSQDGGSIENLNSQKGENPPDNVYQDVDDQAQIPYNNQPEQEQTQIPQEQDQLIQRNINITDQKEPEVEKKFTKHYYTYDEVLTDIGMGFYQFRLYCVLFAFCLMEGSQITIFTLMIPILNHEWGVSDELNSIQASVFFAGFLFGSLITGQIADKLGRKQPFIWSAGSTCIIIVLTAFSPNIKVLIIMRGLLGLMCGFIGPLAIALMTEFTPKGVRGRYMSLVQLSISVGQLFGLFVGFFTLNGLDSGDWRSLILYTSIPGILAWIIGMFYLDESPLFLLSSGKPDVAFFILEKINLQNGYITFKTLSEQVKAQLTIWSISSKKKSENANFKTLFEGEHAYLTPVIWYNWFTLCFIYYGILAFLPLILDQMGEDEILFGDDDLVKLFISTASEIIAAGLAAFLIDLKGFGRKNSLIYSFALSGLTSLLVFYNDQNFLLWTYICKFFVTMTFIFAYQFTAEVYETKIRTTGIGTAIAVGRSGGIVMPWVCFALMDIDILSPFLLFAVLSVSVSVLDIFLPFDTLGKDLDAQSTVQNSVQNYENKQQNDVNKQQTDANNKQNDANNKQI